MSKIDESRNEMQERWRSVRGIPPPVGVGIETKSEGGLIQTLIYDRGLWWVRDKSMYVYYTLTHWRPTSPEVRREA